MKTRLVLLLLLCAAGFCRPAAAQEEEAMLSAFAEMDFWALERQRRVDAARRELEQSQRELQELVRRERERQAEDADARARREELLTTVEALKAFQARDFNRFMDLAEDSDRDNEAIQYGIGFCRTFGEGCLEDVQDGFKWTLESANKGYPPAQLLVGRAYMRGEGTEQDWDEAKRWLEKAKSGGVGLADDYLKKIDDAEHVAGLVALVSLLKQVEESPTQKALAAFGEGKWEEGFKLAKDADKGDKRIQFGLAICYSNGCGCEKDIAEAAAWYRKSAEQGFAAAQYNLGLMCFKGEGVEKSPDEALRWLRKAKAGGDEDAAGAIKEIAARSAVDAFNAERWADGMRYAEDADKDESAIQFYLGVCYYNGYGGCGKNLAAAAGWFLKSARQGNPTAQFNYAICCKNGDGVAANLDAAAKWFAEAAKNGHQRATQELETVNTERARREFRAGRMKQGLEIADAANRDDPEIQFFIGECRRTGADGMVNAAGAAVWYRKSAEQGYAAAQYRLAKALQAGAGVDANPKEALEWFLKAAGAGRTDAMMECAAAYEKGLGTDADALKAEDWYRKAAAKNASGARAEVVRLATARAKRAFAAGRIAEGEKLLGDCDKSDPEIQFRMAAMLLAAAGAANHDSAAQWCRKALAQNHPQAAGFLVKIETVRAKEAFERQDWAAAAEIAKSADQQDADILYWRGVSFERGRGVRQCLEKAMPFYEQALAKGSKDAAAAIERVKAAMEARPKKFRDALSALDINLDDLFPEDRKLFITPKTDLAKTIESCQPGTTIVLGEGTWVWSWGIHGKKAFRIRGASPEKTVITYKRDKYFGGIHADAPLMLENLSLVCSTKAQGIGATDSVLVLDNCRLDGIPVAINAGRFVMFRITQDAKKYSGSGRAAVELSYRYKHEQIPVRAAILDSKIVNAVADKYFAGVQLGNCSNEAHRQWLYCDGLEIENGKCSGIALHYRGRQSAYLRNVTIKKIKRGFFTFDKYFGRGIFPGSANVVMENVSIEDCSQAFWGANSESKSYLYNVTEKGCGKSEVYGDWTRREAAPSGVTVEQFFDTNPEDLPKLFPAGKESNQ